MATKVLQIELTTLSPAIHLEKEYEWCNILILSNDNPLGWINIPLKNGTRTITKETIEDAIKVKFGWKIIQQYIFNSLVVQAKATFPAEPISIIVCTRNRTHFLKDCLKSLLKLKYPIYEIIVVDNAPSNNDTFDFVADLPVRYVKEERPGLDFARNKGLESAKYDIIAYTDDDAEVNINWLEAINNAFEKKEVMAVTGFVAPAELETHAQRVFELGYGGMGHGFERKVFNKKQMTEQQLIWASGFGVGANMAFRKKVFEKIGNFDLALDVGTPSRGGGDIEMFHRIVAKGFVLVYDPKVIIWHKHRNTMKALQNQIADNGCGFGCYLIKCFKSPDLKKTSIIKFLLIDWFIKWNLKNLIRPPKFLPRSFSIIELKGLLSSPFAYNSSKKHVNNILKQHYIKETL